MTSQCFKCFNVLFFCDFFHCSACAFDMCLLNYLLTYLQLCVHNCIAVLITPAAAVNGLNDVLLQYLGYRTNAVSFEVDERYRRFGFEIEDTPGRCRVLRHHALGSRPFVGCVFTSAPVSHPLIASLSSDHQGSSSSSSDDDE